MHNGQVPWNTDDGVDAEQEMPSGKEEEQI